MEDEDETPKLKKDVFWNKVEPKLIEELNVSESIDPEERSESEHFITLVGNGNNRDTML